MTSTQELLARAKDTANEGVLAAASTEEKNDALAHMAAALEAHTSDILAANEADMADAREAGKYGEVMLDRLALSASRIAGMAQGIRDVIALPDPVGRTLSQSTTQDGLELTKVSVPLGVVAIIYESRPNVTSDAAALCIKSGNVCVLRGGKEAYRSSAAIVAAMQEGLAEIGLPPHCITMIEDTTRAGASELMRARGLVDCLIPRGGAGLIRACVEQALVPVIETGTGLCTVYVDAAADLSKALDIVENAKTQRPSVCNAEETLLVHKDVAASFLPALKQRLVDARAAAGLVPVELRVDERAAAIIPGTPATDEDFSTEFLDYILAVGVVDSTEEAVAHIAAHSTHHSDAIITEDAVAAAYFTARVDSAAVYVNASTRFTDGGMFGLGCEMGISTQKLHARGPMGLEELTSYKYIVHGTGQVRK